TGTWVAKRWSRTCRHQRGRSRPFRVESCLSEVPVHLASYFPPGPLHRAAPANALPSEPGASPLGIPREGGFLLGGWDGIEKSARWLQRERAGNNEGEAPNQPNTNPTRTEITRSHLLYRSDRNPLTTGV